MNLLRTGKTQYYWYSAKQAALLSGEHQRLEEHFNGPTTYETYTYKPLFIKSNQGEFDGLVCEYTSVSENSQPPIGGWDDYQLIAIMTPEAVDKLIAEVEVIWQ